MRPGRFGALTVLATCVLVLGGCADDSPDGPDDGADAPTPGAGTTKTPGDLATSWAPAPPASPVDEDGVRSTYDAVLDAASAALAAEAPDLRWSASTVRVEELEGTCAVTLERAAGAQVPADDTLDLTPLSAAIEPAGFGAVRPADDPGGALRYLADGDDGALFELRSKDSTTVAVRVPTTAASCAA